MKSFILCLCVKVDITLYYYASLHSDLLVFNSANYCLFLNYIICFKSFVYFYCLFVKYLYDKITSFDSIGNLSY